MPLIEFIRDGFINLNLSSLQEYDAFRIKEKDKYTLPLHLHWKPLRYWHDSFVTLQFPLLLYFNETVIVYSENEWVVIF